MKTFTMWLLDGKEITLKGETYEDLMCEIDNTLDIFKENVAYYLGVDDNSIIEEMKEQEINFKNICSTIKQEENGLSVLPEVEVWDDSGNLDFVLVNMYNYVKYNTNFTEDGEVYVKSSHPYDEQEYYYAVGNNIYRNGKFIEKIKESEDHYIDGIDEIILRLMELNRPLKSIMCYN